WRAGDGQRRCGAGAKAVARAADIDRLAHIPCRRQLLHVFGDERDSILSVRDEQKGSFDMAQQATVVDSAEQLATRSLRLLTVRLDDDLSKLFDAGARIGQEDLVGIVRRQIGQKLAQSRRDYAAAAGLGLIGDEDDVKVVEVGLQLVQDLPLGLAV